MPWNYIANQRDVGTFNQVKDALLCHRDWESCNEKKKLLNKSIRLIKDEKNDALLIE